MNNELKAKLHHILEHYSEGSKAAYNNADMWEGWTADAITKIDQAYRDEGYVNYIPKEVGNELVVSPV